MSNYHVIYMMPASSVFDYAEWALQASTINQSVSEINQPIKQTINQSMDVAISPVVIIVTRITSWSQPQHHQL